MKNLSHFLCFCLASALSTLAGAADIDNGKRLHDTHCMQCHSSEMYTRENRIVNSLTELKQRIRQCELTNELTWFPEDVDDVAAYLDVTFYRFENQSTR